MARSIKYLKGFTQIIKICALTLQTRCHHTGWLKNLQDHLNIKIVYPLVIWKYVSQKQYTSDPSHWEGNVTKINHL